MPLTWETLTVTLEFQNLHFGQSMPASGQHWYLTFHATGVMACFSSPMIGGTTVNAIYTGLVNKTQYIHAKCHTVTFLVNGCSKLVKRVILVEVIEKIGWSVYIVEFPRSSLYIH